MQFLTMKCSFSRRPELETLEGLDVFPFFLFFDENASEDLIAIGINARGDKQANPVIFYGLSTVSEGAKDGRK